jgi:hypothetical protein
MMQDLNPYGTTRDGRVIEEYTLRNADLSRTLMTLGGIITGLHGPDREGNVRDIVPGCPSLTAYEAGHPHFGAITGFDKRVWEASPGQTGEGEPRLQRPGRPGEIQRQTTVYSFSTE